MHVYLLIYMHICTYLYTKIKAQILGIHNYCICRILFTVKYVQDYQLKQTGSITNLRYVHFKNSHVFMSYAHMYVQTFDCMSVFVPVQCRQNLKAEVLSLNPPRDALAGLSADTTVTVPRKCQIFPFIIKGAPSSYDNYTL